MANDTPRKYCTIRQGIPVTYPEGIAGERLRAILMHKLRWANGTVLTYAFFSPSGAHKAWAGSAALQAQVKSAMARWTELGIGVGFKQVQQPQDAQIRVGFLKGDGHWSYIGRDILGQGNDDRTLNLDPLDGIENGNYGIDVAAHELGHTLGLPHEHQNPKAGIVWDEEKVYAALAEFPNMWPREVTYHNIIEKIPMDDVQGSEWDKDSIMHYPFEKGLILKPEQYQTEPLVPAGGLSARDKTWILTFYPPTNAQATAALPLLTSAPLQLGPGEQRDFFLEPATTRTYQIGTFGESDTVALVYEKGPSGEDVLVGADDDSGEDRNARINVKLVAGRRYTLKIRLYYAVDRGETAAMWW